ncbi:aldehyde dehydrogenase family protein [Falsiroseomonas selenitidurans]|uniref:Aldehyde dehydrogenase n=1 Tax=Falsiroseomonas selenitidurans TaxID=2716335 RepID=A0ABX1E7P9_9PROT|nr:aldehyde dehydrogenase family protein [Falsiroseomonas selenitidurans]NKC32760.1 aldehyde dehydrogenase family protein [Falsiroseomonas selenitidurans]
MSPAEALARLRAAEARDGRLDLDRRRALLARLAAVLLDRAEDFASALDADYGGRSRLETLLADVLCTVDAARHARRHLKSWARPRRVAVPYPFWPARAWEEPVPKGIIGIMAPWNYPVQLALVPVVDALAAGNRVAVKPSEAVPRTAALIGAVLEQALGPDIAATVLGGPAVAADFAAQRWDHLVFTGGTETGRKVAAAAARNLVPVTLELGGKCPALVLPGADLAAAARNILAGKAVNAGQTCIAPDTVLLVGHAMADFHAACRASGIAQAESGLGHAAQAARMQRLAQGAALLPLGPAGDPRSLTLAQPPEGHPLLAEEVFGPLLPVQPLRDLAEAIAWVAARPPPLAIYLFGATRAEESAVAAGTRSGAVVSGRAVEYAAFPDLGFGGVGASGQGRYHGRAGFVSLSDIRSRVRHGGWSLSRLFDLPRKRLAPRLIDTLVRKR